MTPIFLFGQVNKKFVFGKKFNSVFQNLKSGEFKGTTNGILILKKDNNTQLLFDFQGSEAVLQIINDPYEVYDVSTKSYQGKTTSGKTEIKYETYASANGIGIKLNGQWFKLSTLDGASDMVVNGIEYSYKKETNVEYLIIKIDKELELSNWQYLIKNEHIVNPNNIKDLERRERLVKLLPGSVLVFAIKYDGKSLTSIKKKGK